MHVNELIPDIESAIRSIWPDAFLDVNFTVGIYPTINIYFAIGSDKSQWSNGIIHNDPGHHRLTIGGVDRYGITEGGEIEGDVELIRQLGGGISDKSFSTQKVPFRKKKVSPDKVKTLVPAIKTYFERLKKKYDEMVAAGTVKVPGTQASILRTLAAKIANEPMGWEPEDDPDVQWMAQDDIGQIEQDKKAIKKDMLKINGALRRLIISLPFVEMKGRDLYLTNEADIDDLYDLTEQVAKTIDDTTETGVWGYWSWDEGHTSEMDHFDMSRSDAEAMMKADGFRWVLMA